MTSRGVFDRFLPPAEIRVSDYTPLQATVWLSGEIDAECGQALRCELRRQQAARRRLVRLDMNAVSFLDTSALEVIREAHHTWLRMRGTLVLFGVTGPTLRMLEVTGLDRELLHMPPTADDRLRRDRILTAVGA